ncbi:hypothetical protein AeMF1_002946 [Aphanomyces euteiches]|nr:hypothetical protein AeMF1_002946 [Aphanomyces euteiches]
MPLKTTDGKISSWKCSALMYASRVGHIDLVRLLLAQDHIDLNAKQEKSGWTALILAAANGRVEIAQLLINYDGVAVNLKDIVGSDDLMTPLHYAAMYGYAEIVKILLDNDATDTRTKNHCGETPLYSAVKCGHVHVVKLLLELSRFDLSSGEWVRQFLEILNGTLFGIAATNGHLEVLELLLSYGGRDSQLVRKHLATTLLYATRKGHLDIVQMLLRDFAASINFKSTNACMALSDASTKGHAELVQTLLKENRIGVEWSRESINNALQCAVGQGHLEIVQMFLEYEDIGSENLARALHQASEIGHIDIVRLLLANETVDINFQTMFGQTALHFAAMNDHIEIVHILIDQGIDVNLTSHHGKALLGASMSGYSDNTQMSLKQQVVGNKFENRGRTALHVAAQHGHADIVQALIDCERMDLHVKTMVL